MSDFERRVEEALASGAEGAPDASGLADGARRRVRRRRRTTVAVAAAAVVAAVAVPVGVIALGNGGGSDDVDRAEDPPVADTRIETWHDIQVEVPASWGYGPRTTWCLGREAETPVVERPGGVVAAIACDPSYSFGVSWVDGSTEMVDPVYPSGEVWQYEAGEIKEYVPGSWLGYWYEGDDMVQVNAADKETVQAILDSVQRVDGVDANGCPVTRQEGFTTDSERMSVCRYDGGGQLEQSELLSAEDTEAAIAALRAAPPGDPEMLASCAQDQLPRLVVQMVNTDVNSEVIIQAPCPYRPGITSGGESFQELTPDVLYWALSPGWSGSVSEGVTLPEPLRTLPAEHSYDSGEPFCQDRSASGASGATYEAMIPSEDQLPLVCRYELDWGAESGGSYVLDSERKIADEELQDIRAGLEAAPTVDFPVSQDCAQGRGELFTVYWNDGSAEVYNGECGGQYTLTVTGAEPSYKATSAELLDTLGSPYGLLR